MTTPRRASGAAVVDGTSIPISCPVAFTWVNPVDQHTPAELDMWRADVAAAQQHGHRFAEYTFTIHDGDGNNPLGTITIEANASWRGGPNEGRLAELAARAWRGLSTTRGRQPPAAIRATAPSGTYATVAGDDVTIRTRKTRTKRGTKAAPAGHLMIMSDPHSVAAIRGIYAASNGHGDTWRQRGSDAPMYIDGKNGVAVYSRTANGEALTQAGDIEAAWRQILTLDDRHVSTFLICLGKWFAETTNDGGPAMDSVRVSVDDVLGFRGVKKHVNGGYKPEQKREARGVMLALNNIWMKSTDQVTPGHKW